MVNKRSSDGTKSITLFLPWGSEEVDIYPLSLLTKNTFVIGKEYIGEPSINLAATGKTRNQLSGCWGIPGVSVAPEGGRQYLGGCSGHGEHRRGVQGWRGSLE